ncbi:2-C-methyl-D-erythritol 4-phosphate cytidylyltransferase [Angustibacter luteus]|uniref:2-C-methyl-D-erythritol 4-phosphate cytidylyltransferase n=1 Tax=Angustibacter luteus TaxID=658456 RepID=A0ABW1JCW9_9ACTN
MTTGAVVVAAGSGSRLGADRPKAFVQLAGVTLLEHAVARLRDGGVRAIVAVVPDALVGQTQALLGDAAQVVAGGAERQDSVAAGLAALPADVDVVLVHDAARCLAPAALVARVASAVTADSPAVVPGLPVVDTVKEVDASGLVVGTVDRAPLRRVQTPQGFERALLERAHAAAGDSAATDDAALVERLGVRVRLVEGDPLALKVTTAEDLALAEWLLTRLSP